MEARFSRAAPLFAAIGTLVLGVVAWPYTVDDAWVLGRYASRLASGEGWTFVDGPATDGVTGPLAIVPGALAALVGLDAVAAMKGLGLVATALAVALAVRRARRRAIGPLAASAACAFVLSSGSLAIWGTAGLETGLATLAASGLGLAVTSRPPRVVWASIAAAALPALRPELVPFAVVLVVGLVRRDRRAGLVTFAALLTSLAVLAIGRYVLFGSPLPMSLAAKPPALENGLRYALGGLAFAFGGLAIAPALLGASRSGRVRWALAAIGVHVVAVLAAGGDWMPGYRLLAPVLPLYGWVVGVGIAELARDRRGGARLAIGVAALACALPLLDLVIQLPAARAAGNDRETSGRALAEWLDANAHRVALVDVGFLAYGRTFTPVDLAGITDPEIARIAEGHVDAPITGAMLLARDVDAIVLSSWSEPTVAVDGSLTALGGHPTERRLAADATVRANFRVDHLVRYSSSTWYAVLVRREP